MRVYIISMQVSFILKWVLISGVSINEMKRQVYGVVVICIDIHKSVWFMFRIDAQYREQTSLLSFQEMVVCFVLKKTD